MSEVGSEDSTQENKIKIKMATDWNRLTVSELKEELQNHGLEATGKKAELVARIEQSEEVMRQREAEQEETGSEETETEATYFNTIPTTMPMMTQNESRPQPMRVQPRTYDGKASWGGYYSFFERVGRINKWTEDQKIDYLWVNLVGEALTFVDNLPRGRTMTYTALCQALEERFGDSQRAEVFKSGLRSRKRKDGESLPALAQEISHLVRRAYPGIGQQGMEELAVEKFREALPDHEQRMSVFRSKAKTIDQAVRAALDTESWQISENRRTPAARTRSTRSEEEDENSQGMTACAVRSDDIQLAAKWINELKDLVKLLAEKTEQSESGNADVNGTSSRKSQVTCYYCHKLGHLQRECRKKKADERRAQSGNGPQQR